MCHHPAVRIRCLPQGFAGPAVYPKVALVDPDLTVGSPAPLTAACGADALGHAIEACMSRTTNPISSTLAGRAVGLIVANLGRAVEVPDGPEPREPLALAATLAGVAFSAAGVVVPHAIALDSKGLLYVNDRNSGRVQIFDQSGTFQDQWSNVLMPWGISINDKDEIWVCGSSPHWWYRHGEYPEYKDQVFMRFSTDGRV